jgi:hypothetical protein
MLAPDRDKKKVVMLQTVEFRLLRDLAAVHFGTPSSNFFTLL